METGFERNGTALLSGDRLNWTRRTNRGYGTKQTAAAQFIRAAGKNSARIRVARYTSEGWIAEERTVRLASLTWRTGICPELGE